MSIIAPSVYPTHKRFGKMDLEFCMEQAHWIMKNIPVSEQTELRRVWRFHKDSAVPLIQEAQLHINKVTKAFEETYRRSPSTTFFILTETLKDSDDPIWFKDKVSQGQMHFSIEGGSNIDIDNGTKIKNVTVPEGSVWFLNSSQYMHRPVDTNGATRIEMFAPISQAPTYIKEKLTQVVDNKWKYLKHT